MHAGVSMLSVIDKNPETFFHFYIITCENNPEEFDKLHSLVKNTPHALTIFQTKDNFFKNLPSTQVFPNAIYYRLFAPYLLNSFAKILYIDADIIALNAFGRLLETDMTESLCAVVKEPSDQEVLSSAINIPSGHYFNSGVLLINPQKWCENNVSQQVIDILQQQGCQFKYFDQDALNITLLNKVTFIDGIYNMQMKIRHGKEDFRIMPSSDTVLLHYVGDNKPWQEWNQQDLTLFYKKYFSISPWSERVFPKPNSLEDMRKYYKSLFHKKNYLAAAFWVIKYKFSRFSSKR